ncbi:MAG: hypothetical protein PHY02_00920 [Phycisphaerae bacterium]|nr:hypothetical protein [Phycisphaerae bacterium]
MKKLTLNILLLILMLTAASAGVLQAAVVNVSLADNGMSYFEQDPNEPVPEPIPEPEFISSLIRCLDEDPNEPVPEPVPEPECI